MVWPRLSQLDLVLRDLPDGALRHPSLLPDLPLVLAVHLRFPVSLGSQALLGSLAVVDRPPPDSLAPFLLLLALAERLVSLLHSHQEVLPLPVSTPLLDDRHDTTLGLLK